MGIMTVNGVIHREELGVTTPHEHALIDIRNQYQGECTPGCMEFDGKVGKEHFELLMSDPYALRDNLLLEDEEKAIQEIAAFAKEGGQSFVDVTPSGLGRNAGFLKRLADRTGLHVVASCGFYTADTHPARIADMTVEDLAQEMVNELTVGIDGTGIRAGIIGEIGTSQILYMEERKVLEASAMAHVRTGAPVMVHLHPWAQQGALVTDILEYEGVAPEHICLCHTDVLLDRNDMRRLLERGVYLEFDNFGKEFTTGSSSRRFPGDTERLEVMYQLMDEGYIKQLLVACDICLKNLLQQYGGIGYGYFIRNIAERIRERKVDAEEILHRLLVENPAQYLDNSRLG